MAPAPRCWRLFCWVKTLQRKSGCKVNLLLNILRKRGDGFHELETVIQPVPYFDELEFEAAGSSVFLTSDHPTLPCDDSNLMVRAAHAFFEHSRIAAGVRMHLRKRIPMEAGLGGGSSNAAATLLGLNELFDCPLDGVRLRELAASLGSDVPFFLQEHPALATGRGEMVAPLDPFPALNGLVLVLVHPGFGVSTPWAYRELAHHPEVLNGRAGRAGELIQQLQTPHSRSWGPLLFNSLEVPVFEKYPVLRLYVDCFLREGAQAALMSGSGSTVFAWFEDAAGAESGLTRFRSEFGSATWGIVLA